MNNTLNYVPKFKTANESVIFLLGFSSYIFFKVVKTEQATRMLTQRKKCFKSENEFFRCSGGISIRNLEIYLNQMQTLVLFIVTTILQPTKLYSCEHSPEKWIFSLT